MKTLKIALLTALLAATAAAQTPTYNLILKNDALVDSTTYEFDIWMERTGGVALELASLQPVMTFNTGISAGALTLTINGGTSGLNALQAPNSMSVSGNELHIEPRTPPGAGAGTVIPVSPGLRVGRFRITSTTAFTAQHANIAWKNNTNPFTKVFAYNLADLNVEVTDSTGHLSSLTNPGLSPPIIISTSPRPAATAGVLYRDTLRAQGGTLPLSWSVIAGAFPTGITMTAAGIISGTAVTPGAFNFTARVVDNVAAADTAEFSLTVNAGSPAQLAFVQQPTDEIAGVFITPSPTVRIMDNVGNTVPVAGIAVSMSLTSGNGTLSGSLTELTNASGIATFDSLRIDRKGAKVITALSSGLTSAVSSSFNILGANATVIRVETAADGTGVIVPAQNVAPLSPITVYAISRDSFDNFIENVAASTWTLQGVTGGVVAGDLVPAGDNRSATFTGHLTGTAQIRAASPPLTSVNSGTITVVPGAARKLAFIQQPSNGAAGAVITPAVTVQLRDTANNAVAQQNVGIQMSLSSGTGTLGGTLSQLTDASGLASFGDLTVDLPGIKALTAASAGLTSAVSNNFTLSTFTITATAGPNGSISPSGAVSVTYGANQAFTIAANPLYHITGVLVDGSPVGAVSNYTFTNVTANHTIAASFGPDTLQVTVQSAPAGRAIRVDGVLLTAPQVFGWVSGSSHTIATDSIQNGTAGTRYLYQSWSDAGAMTHSVTPTSDTTFTVGFGTQYFLTMSAGAGGTVSPVSDWKESGAVVPISATPNTGFSFSGWTGTGSGSVNGSANPTNVTMNGPITETGNFGTNPISVVVTTNPAGRQIIVDGVTFTSPQIFNWTATESHSISVDSVQDAGGGTRYLYTSWGDGGARTHTVTPLTDSTFTANFSTQYFLTMTAGTGGTVSPVSDWKNPGQVVAISATPSAGYTFGGWTGTGTGSFTGPTNPTSVTMNGPITQAGSFTPNPISVTVTTAPAGLSIIVDDTTYISPHTFNWLADQSHTISVDSIQNGAAGIRYLYSSWSNGGSRTQTIDPLAGGTITASFTTQYFVTMVANTGGTVTPPSNWFNAGQGVVITGIADQGYVFSSWAGTGSGSYNGNTNPQTITPGGPVTQTANFVQPPVNVTIEANPSIGTFRVDGSGLITNTYTFSFSPGTTHTISADSLQPQSATSRLVWTSWSDGGARSHTLTYPGKDTTIVVNFKTQFQLSMIAGTGGTVSPPTGFFDSAQVVGISATPGPTYAFSSWTGSGLGSYTGPNNPSSVTMNGPITETGNFTLTPINVTINTVPPGRTFSVDGTTFTGPQNFVWSSSVIHALSTTSPQGDTATRFLYSSWSDGGTQSHSVAPLSDTTFTLNFSTQHFLTMDTGTGFGNVSPASNWFNAGQVVPISATPDVGYDFSGWTGTGASAYTGPNNPQNITMNTPVKETANWSAGTVPVTVTTVPAGLSITVDGTNYTSPQAFNWTTGSSHTIAADSIQAGGLPGSRYRWLSWSDAGERSHTVAPGSPATYTATFRSQYLLTMVANPGGTVTPATSWYDSSSSVIITGIPNTGYGFSTWSGTGTGAYSGSANPRTISVLGPITETANFTQLPVQVTIQTNPPGRTFRVDAGSLQTNTYTFTYSPGDAPHTVTADSIQGQTAASRFVWTSWSDGGARTHTLPFPGRDTTFIVNFKKQHFLTMSAGIGGTVLPASGYFDSAASVGITATPSGGYTFSGWVGSGPGSYTGPDNPGSVTMDSAISETGTFTLAPINVTVQSNPPGLQFTVDGTTYTGSQGFVWSATSPHTLAAVSPQGDTATRYLFTSWSDGGAQSHSVAPILDTTFTVNYSTQYFLTMDTGTGGGTVSPPNGFFNAGASVEISAVPRAGYTFDSWSGTGTGSYSGPNNPASVTMNSPVKETAVWAAGTIPVTVTTVPAGLSITVDGTTYTSPQTFNWTTGSSHSISADSLQPSGTTGQRYRWTSWSDAGTLTHTVAPAAAATFTATFGTQYLLTMAANPGGTVTPPTGWYDAGSPVTITGVPNSGFSFSGWTGTGSGSYSGGTNPRSITIGGPITEVANFTQNPVSVTIQAQPSAGTFRVDGSGVITSTYTFLFSPGTTHTLSADSLQPQTATSRLVWTGWSDGGARTHTIFFPGRDTTIIVYFKTQYYLTMSAGAGGTVLPANGYFDSASTVPISATPSIGYTFAGWTGAGEGNYSGPNNPASVQMLGPITETGSFTLFPITVRLRSNPAGRNVVVDSVSYVTPQDLIWTSGTTHTISADSVQDGAPGVRHIWTGWSDGKARTHTATGFGDTTFTVNFRQQYFLTMTAGAGGTVAPANSWYDSAASVPITATPSTGYNFAGWTGGGNGSYTGALNPSSVTMHSPVAETAAFALKTISVTVRTNPDGYPVMVDDTLYTSPKIFSWLAGSSHSISTDSLQAPSGGMRPAWKSWNDGGARTHTVAPLTDSVFTARFAPQFYLTMVANPGGTVAPASGWFDTAQVVPIQAIPASGYSFTTWSGSGSGAFNGGANPASVTMRGPITETANFTLSAILVTVQTNPPGRSFRVDGTAYISVNTFPMLPGSSHTFAADSIQAGVNGRRYVWTSWSDSGARSHNFVAPSKDSTVVVNFGLQYELATFASPLGGGTIQPPGQTYFNAGDTASVLAVANAGYAFTSWTGSVSSASNPVRLVMDTAKTLTAQFQPAATVYILSNTPGRSVIVDGFTTVTPDTFSWLINSNHTIGTSTPQSGEALTQYVWASWSDSGAISHTVTVDRDTAFTAEFQTQHYLLIGSDTNGTVQPSPGWFNEGATVLISATPKPGYGFIEWTGTGPGGYTGFSNPATLTMTGYATQSASFGAVLPPPSLTGIPNHAVDQPIAPLLSWNAYAGADSFIVQTATDSLFSPQSMVVEQWVKGTSLALPTLRNVTPYFWRVKARVGSDITSFSETRDFVTIGATIAVTSPALNWGTGFTYDISWAAQNLSGKVNVLLSTDAGAAFNIIDSNLSGTTSRFRVPPTQTPSNFCVVRVVSADNGQFYGDSRTFAILPGALSLIVPVSASIPFPAEPTISTFYRLVSYPGVVDTLVRLSALIPGANPKDWRMFADNGRPTGYLEEMGPSSAFETGRGFWLLKRNDLGISANMVMPPLDTINGVYRIKLRSGWNIIANPFDRNASWSSILGLNGLPSGTPLYGYEGSYQPAPLLSPFRGYYFYNSTNLSELKIAYPFGTAIPAVAARGTDWELRLEYSSEINDDPANFIGVAPAAREGLDEMESHKPPLFLDQGFLYFERPDWDREYDLFNTDFRPSIGEGQTWDFEVSREYGTTGTLRFDGVDGIPAEYEVVLLNEFNTTPVNLRTRSEYSFASVSSKMPFKLLVGPKEYVDREVAALLPKEFELAQNFPNPFNSTTSIRVKLPRDARIRLDVYSVLGERVATLADGDYPGGVHTFLWEGTDDRGMAVSSGVYLYRLMEGDRMLQAMKMIIAK